MDDMNDSRSHALRALDVMNNSSLMMVLTILVHELKAIDAMNSSRL